MLLTARTSTPAPTRKWSLYVKVCFQHHFQLERTPRPADLSSWNWLKQLNSGPPIQGWHVMNSKWEKTNNIVTLSHKKIKVAPVFSNLPSLILTLTTWWIALKKQFRHMATAKTTRGFYKAQVLCEKREKSLALWVMRVFEGQFFFMGWFQSYLYFFYCKSLFDCWKNQVIRGIKSHHKCFMNLVPRAASRDKLLCRGFWFWH